MKSKKVLLVAPSDKVFYKDTKIKAAVPYTPLPGLPSLASILIKKGHDVKIFDFNFGDNDFDKFNLLLKEFNPSIVGITFTTPLFNEMLKICESVKNFNEKVLLIGGGAHASSFPEQTLKDSLLDVVVIGEGESKLLDIVDDVKLKKMKGICLKEKNNIISTEKAGLIKDLDALPFPAWEIYNYKEYKTSKLISRKNPVGWVETSRGCVYGCVYCNKSVFGRTFRIKSARRVVDEFEHMVKLGFKELHIADDCFTTDMKRAEEICDEILKRNIKILWATVTGIRVDRVSKDLLYKMKKAGCYCVYFGIESGNQDILDKVGKGIKLEQVVNAVKWAKEVGLEVVGFFMIALPGETEKTMQDTINFAKRLDLDMAKLSIMIPLPATAVFDDFKSRNLIKTMQWEKFNYYVIPKEIYDHPNLSWDVIDKYYNKFYKEFYFRPGFILKRFIKGIKSGTIFNDIYVLLRTKW